MRPASCSRALLIAALGWSGCSTPADCARALPTNCPEGTAPYAVGTSEMSSGGQLEYAIALETISIGGTHDRVDSCEVGCVPVELQRVVDDFGMPSAWCGGSPEGTWTLEGSCDLSEPYPSFPGCPESTMVVYVDYSGATVTYDADGSFVGTMGDVTATVVELIPESCLGGATCADVGAQGGDGWCTTTTTHTEPGTSVGGEWSVSGSRISHSGIAADFCVEGDAMRIFHGEVLEVWSR